MLFDPPVGGPEQDFPDADETRRLDAITAEAEAASRRAKVLAEDLVGMRVDDAREIVGRHPGLSLEIRDPHGAYIAVAFFGRIYGHVENGRIVSTSMW